MFISPARCANCDSFITASQRCITWVLSPGSPPCLDAPAGHSSAFVTLDCASVVWQSLLTFGTPAPSSSTQDSALSPPPRWVSAQIVEQQRRYSKTQLHSSFCKTLQCKITGDVWQFLSGAGARLLIRHISPDFTSTSTTWNYMKCCLNMNSLLRVKPTSISDPPTFFYSHQQRISGWTVTALVFPSLFI